ncbi:MAG TPA: hypothetical protein VG898_11000 [Solirubrobacterales bacterium]|nr:hypothetical protein [Solirubrobacterales bacterium]
MSFSRAVQAFVVSCCLFTIGVVASAGAAPGDVDRTFGQEGVARVQAEQGAYVAPEDMAVAPGSGQIYVLRYAQICSQLPCTSEQLVSRYTRGGLLDSSFGNAGIRRFLRAATNGYNGNGSIAVAPDGRVVVGSTDDGNLLLGRLNADGSPDASFGSGGEAEIHLGAPVDRVRVAVQADGRIVVGAEPLSGYGGDAVLIARFTAQGLPDLSFRDGNPLITSLGSGLGGLALAGGKVVVAGPRCCGAEGRAVHLARIDESGVFDSSFGRQGERFVDDVTNGAGVGALIVRPGGGIIVVGSGRGGKGGGSFALALKPKGALDLRFGRRGIAYLGHKRLTVNGAVVDRAGRLLIAGSSSEGAGRGARGRALSVLRRRPNGSPDRTFAGGDLVHLTSLRASHADAVGLQGGRSLVVLASRGGCSRTCESPTAMLVRFLGGTSASRCLGRRATIVGTRHGEKLVGTPHRDVIAALAGNDRVLGRGGNDLICGGRGGDRLIGGKGRDAISGGAGRNQIHQ